MTASNTAVFNWHYTKKTFCGEVPLKFEDGEKETQSYSLCVKEIILFSIFSKEIYYDVPDASISRFKDGKKKRRRKKDLAWGCHCTVFLLCCICFQIKVAPKRRGCWFRPTIFSIQFEKENFVTYVSFSTTKSKLQNCRMQTVYLCSCHVGLHVGYRKQNRTVPIVVSTVT